MQVDVRLLPPDSFGAAMQYFTGSKAHNVALRQRALKMGYTLNEYSLATLEGGKPVAGKTEEEIYAKLKLDYVPPEMRENLGEIDLAQNHALPQLITEADLQGDVHMHTVETDGKNTIEEMVEFGFRFAGAGENDFRGRPSSRQRFRRRRGHASSPNPEAPHRHAH